MSLPNIKPGDRVRCLDAYGNWAERRALTSIERGRDFPVVWICQPEHYDRALVDETIGVPWPATDVEPLSETADSADQPPPADGLLGPDSSTTEVTP